MKDFTSANEQVWDTIRAHKRITIEKATEINSCKCRIMNISTSGMMISSPQLHGDGPVEIMMEIDGAVVTLEGQVVWSTDNAHEDCFDMGIYITNAPASFRQFVDNLYLEVKERNVNYPHLFNENEH